MNRYSASRIPAAVVVIAAACLVGITDDAVTAQAATPPTTAVIVPSAGASVSDTSVTLDAGASAASGATIAKVQFALTGGTLTKSVIATATPTIYGYVATWDSTSVPNGTYTLQSVASYSGGVSGTSVVISVAAAN